MRFLFSLLGLCASLRATDQPNILWITAEDMSPNLGCYGDKYAVSPNIDRLAKESVRFIKAFASAPVFSPSRSCWLRPRSGLSPSKISSRCIRAAYPSVGFPAG